MLLFFSSFSYVFLSFLSSIFKCHLSSVSPTLSSPLYANSRLLPPTSSPSHLVPLSPLCHHLFFHTHLYFLPLASFVALQGSFFKFLTLHVHVDINFGLKIKLLKLNVTAYINILERIDISVQLEGGLPSGSNSRG